MSAQKQGEPVVNFLIVLGLFAGLCWLFWRITGDFWLDNVFRWWRYGYLWVIGLFTPEYNACMDWLRYAGVNDPTPSGRVVLASRECFGARFLAFLPAEEAIKYYSLTGTSMASLGRLAGSYYKWIVGPILFGIAFYTVFTSPRNKFITTHTLETLIYTQAKMWPIISPIVKFNPSKSGRILGETVPDKLPLFAEALSPEEWVSWNRIPLQNGVPDRDSARRAFIRQLGPRWNGVSSLPLHMRALLAAFALKGVQKREESDELLGRLAMAWSPEKGFRPNMDLRNEIDGILRDPKIGGKMEPFLDQHAWRTTAILGALFWARNSGGVLAPAQFLWVRAEDRALWYPLNNLGRRAFHSEGAGAMAHYMAEVAAKKPLPIPRVDTAVITLNTYLHDPDKRSIPIPPREGDKA